MKTAGYSKKSLQEKLDIKPGMSVAVIHAPEGYEETFGGEIPTWRGIADVIQFFATERSVLELEFARLKAKMDLNGMLWICWPKATSGMETTLTENVVRDIGLQNGLVDVKVCAVDDVWSGLKFVYRLSDREAAAAR